MRCRHGCCGKQRIAAADVSGEAGPVVPPLSRIRTVAACHSKVVRRCRRERLGIEAPSVCGGRRLSCAWLKEGAYLSLPTHAMTVWSMTPGQGPWAAAPRVDGPRMEGCTPPRMERSTNEPCSNSAILLRMERPKCRLPVWPRQPLLAITPSALRLPFGVRSVHSSERHSQAWMPRTSARSCQLWKCCAAEALCRLPVGARARSNLNLPGTQHFRTAISIKLLPKQRISVDCSHAGTLAGAEATRGTNLTAGFLRFEARLRYHLRAGHSTASIY